MAQPPIDAVIRKYIELRDEQAAICERHKQELEPISEQMGKLEAWLMAKLDAEGAQNFKTDAGTAFKNTSTSATVGDDQAFKRFLLQPFFEQLLPYVGDASRLEAITNEFIRWGLADLRAGKTGIMSFIEEGNPIPPGINIKQFVKVNVRRA
jgi:hypothetical protein